MQVDERIVELMKNADEQKNQVSKANFMILFYFSW